MNVPLLFLPMSCYMKNFRIYAFNVHPYISVARGHLAIMLLQRDYKNWSVIRLYFHGCEKIGEQQFVIQFSLIFNAIKFGQAFNTTETQRLVKTFFSNNSEIFKILIFLSDILKYNKKVARRFNICFFSFIFRMVNMKISSFLFIKNRI